MSISSINYTNSLYSQALLGKSNDDSDNGNSLLEKLSQQASGNAETGESALSPGRKMLQAGTSASQTLSELQQSGVAITKENIDTEIQRKELMFQLLVATSLKAMGVDEDVEFKMSLDSNGNIQISSSHKDAAAVQKFFDDNPELSEDFASIESLKNFRKSMDAGSMSSVSLRRNIQAENLSAYFEGMEENESVFSPLIMSYSKNSMLALSGISLTV